MNKKGLVKMIGPNGKISYCSEQVANSGAAAAIGFRRYVDTIPQPAYQVDPSEDQKEQPRRGRPKKVKNGSEA